MPQDDLDGILRRRILQGRRAAPRKFSGEEQQLRDFWNRQENQPVPEDKLLGTIEGDRPLIPEKPGIFQPDPPVVGSELGRFFNEFVKLAPNLKRKVSRIQYGPGKVAATDISNSGKYNPEDWVDRNLTLLGITDTRSGEININPNLGSPEFLRRKGNTAEYGDYSPDETLAHELTHVAGKHSEEEPTVAQEMVYKMRENKKRETKRKMRSTPKQPRVK